MSLRSITDQCYLEHGGAANPANPYAMPCPEGPDPWDEPGLTWTPGERARAAANNIDRKTLCRVPSRKEQEA